ncbi:hypothetical protein DE146DRAFT_621122 [Phaeosphaeria sp. MPI-PUGE-AT-0046c]|nr:hypothetical protein DE146DRAFT_621122 [Phaeosphaeria sp. MPI-PUGE-AT-0046c]
MSFHLRPALTAIGATRTAGTRAFSATAAARISRMTVIGRLGAQPEEVSVAGDRTLVRYVVGSNYGKKGEQKTSWFRVASFVEGPQKEYLLGVPKGSLLYVEAEARMESYTDKEGNTRSNLSLIARNFDVLSRSTRTDEVAENDEGLVQEGSA